MPKAPQAAWKTRVEEMRERILSGELAPGTRIDSEDRLAETWGVSRQTAHRVLAELQREGFLVRQRRWGTVVAPRSRRRHGRIGLLMDSTHGVFQSSLLSAIEAALGDRYAIQISDTWNDPAREAAQIERMRGAVDGLIVYPVGGEANVPLFRGLLEEGFPLVLVDRSPRGLESEAVLTDHADAAYRLVRGLLERGHRRVAFFAGDNAAVSSVRDRYRGYARALAEIGAPAPEPYVREVGLALQDRPATMVRAMADALAGLRALPEPPTAAFCVQDALCIGLLGACDELGLDVPGDLEIATFNDYPPMTLRAPWRLERAVQNAAAVAVSAVARLEARIEGDPVAAGPVLIPARVVPSGLSSLDSPTGAEASAALYQRR